MPTLPLFVHERLSTQAILQTLKGHKRDKQMDMFELFADPKHSIADQVLKAYEYQHDWVNRMILGDSLVAMNSLLHYEGLGGQVQMIYMDPPYGVKFGSNFQPFVRKRDVKHNEDEDMTREPEMVQAYRDTWELGTHSYLTYLRDRLLLSKDLLHPSGSIFLQIGNENEQLVRIILDEVFGEDNFVTGITFLKTSGFKTNTIASLGDRLLWYAKDKAKVKARKCFQANKSEAGSGNATWLILPNGKYRGVTAAEARGESPLPAGAKLYNPDNIISQGAASSPQPFRHEGRTYLPGENSHWKANYPEGMKRLAEAGRIHVAKNSIRYRRYADDFPYEVIGNVWTDTRTGNFTDDKIYVVQTGAKVIERCIHLTTDPGDLVLDPTCGSGTTAYKAEQWGRRWITIDVSRVPLALARQRVLSATFPWYGLMDEKLGPAAGFRYLRWKDAKAGAVVGIVPHVGLETIANDEPPSEEVLVDCPEESSGVTRVSGPFTFEATIPTPRDWTEAPEQQEENYGSFIDRMLEVLRRSPILRLEGNKSISFTNVRAPAKTLSLSAEASMSNGQGKPVAFVFGPENGAVSEKLVYEAAREATAKNYAHLYVIGFAIQANARELVEKSEEAVGVAATYVQATPDLLMGDLLKNLKSSQIFSVCGLPEVRLLKSKVKDSGVSYQVKLLGLDVFDPVTTELTHRKGDDVPAWFIDTDYNGLCFHVTQAFFPRTSAWDNLKKALKGQYEDSVWDHLAGATSAPFTAGEHSQVAIKVIDDRGNELLVVKPLSEAGE